MGTQDIVTPQQQPQTNDPQVYNPIDISSIVHGSGVPNELPTTLPPLNSSILSTPHSTTQGSPIRNDHSQLSQGTAPLGQYQQQSGTTASCIAQQDYDQQQQQQQQEFTPGLSPYGCGIHGCFANFPLSSGLFYHMKSAAHHMDGGGNGEKPYRCAMPGCTKRYKNINGLQYHLREAKGSSGHGIAPPGEDIGKNYRCDVPGCKKAYRTANGLRYHQTHSHSTPPPPHQQQQQQQQQSSSPTIVNRHYPSLVLQQQLQQNDQSSSSVLNRHYHASPGLQQQTSPLPSRSHLQQSQQQQHPMTNLTYQQQQQLHRHQQEQLRSTQGTDGF
ncbi:hypothetical protein BC941DRAFT_42909 [Chlamydoabsidia padenii]|nr:hypothetical protein BC941DRAFT_42909 [Chlamydoabsidia padenii]